MAETMFVKGRPLESHIQRCYCMITHFVIVLYDNSSFCTDEKSEEQRNYNSPEVHNLLVAEKGWSLRQTDFSLPTTVVLNVKGKK